MKYTVLKFTFSLLMSEIANENPTKQQAYKQMKESDTLLFIILC